MPARVLVLGLDAAEPSVFTDPDATDLFPTLTGMQSAGAFGMLDGLFEMLTDTVWPEIRTGSSAVGTGIYYQPRQFRSGEPRARALRPGELRPERFYWNVAAAAGSQVAAVDQPLTPGSPDGAAVEIVEWGTHDRAGFGSRPADPISARIVESHGDHPVWECDRLSDGSSKMRRVLLERIHAGVERKASLLVDLVESRDWDLVTAVFSEAHCAGHHFWPPEETGGSTEGEPEPSIGVIQEVYRRLDGALGAVIAAAGPAPEVIVYSSHGMSPADHGITLVAGVLERMGLVGGNPRRRRLAGAVPARLRGPIRKVAGTPLLQRAGLTYDRALGDANTLAVPLPNSRHGAIRLSIAGRDPDGAITPGSDAHGELLDRLHREFRALRTPDGGESVVEQVVVVDDVLGPDRHPDLPDVIVRFRTDLGPIGVCRSDSLGTVHPAVRGHRTGDHGTPGAVWTTGPDIGPGSLIEAVRTVDLAPTVLAKLGVGIPDWVDGTAIIR